MILQMLGWHEKILEGEWSNICFIKDINQVMGWVLTQQF